MSEPSSSQQASPGGALRLSYRRENQRQAQLVISAEQSNSILPSQCETPFSARRVAVLDSAPCRLGEGAGYDPNTDTAWWFDLLCPVLHERSIQTGVSRTIRMPGRASLLVPTDGAHPLVAMDDGLHVWDRGEDRFHPYLTLNAGASAKMRTHCGRVHPSGSLWIASMHHDAAHGCGMIHVVRNGQAQLLFDRLTVPSSICFSPDGTAGYFADTPDGVIYRVALDPQSGLPIGLPQVFFDGSHRPGGIDGSVVDRGGTLWNVRWGTASLDAYEPNGRWQKTITLPAAQPTSLVFIGGNAENLLITSAAVGLPCNEVDGRAMIVRSLFRGCVDAAFRLT